MHEHISLFQGQQALLPATAHHKDEHINVTKVTTNLQQSITQAMRSKAEWPSINEKLVSGGGAGRDGVAGKTNGGLGSGLEPISNKISFTREIENGQREPGNGKWKREKETGKR